MSKRVNNSQRLVHLYMITPTFRCLTPSESLCRQIGAISRDVKHMNIDDSSEIDDILPQQGPEGLPVYISMCTEQ